MATWGPMSVRKAVDQVAADRLLVPGIQRAFVWKPEKIEALFDSLLRGYPLGHLLLWKTQPADHPQLRFRRLFTDAQLNGTPPLARPGSMASVFGVLDGQQRLTALNIGLRGSFAANETATARWLYLDLDYDEPDAGAEGAQYRFALVAEPRDDGAWFPVRDALGLGLDAASLNRALDANHLGANSARRRVLKALVRGIEDPRSMRAEVETSPDLDRVLNIFARVNRGGTQLTYVDLLISTATARWRDLDAREKIEELRREMVNSSPLKLKVSADRIVKAGLVLLDAKEPKFHVDSFMRGDRARRLEESWPAFRQSMVVAARTLAEMGLTARSMPAENVLIPVAYYAHHRRLKPGYPTAHRHQRDRQLIRAFVARTLLQRRYWTGAVDEILVAVRRAIRADGSDGFPLETIARELRPIKPIDVTKDLIAELCDLRYGDRRTLTLLSLLFPHMILDGLTGKVDKDHLFPISRFAESARVPKGLSRDEWIELKPVADRLPNLQLVRAEDNRGGGKSAQMPKLWLGSLSAAAKRRYAAQDVIYVPDDVAKCLAFWDKRRDKLRTRIVDLLDP